MAMSKNPRRYTDVQRLLDVAIAKGECLVAFNRPGQAATMARRVNAFQQLMEGLDPMTPYTNYAVTRGGVDKTTLVIQKRTLEAAGGTILTEHDEADIQPTIQAETVDPLSTVEALLRAEGLGE